MSGLTPRASATRPAPTSTTMTVSKRRARTLARIQRRLAWPRLQMMLVVALTGAAGSLSSFILLRTGVEALPPRYLLSVAIAYATFLTLLGLWVRLRRWEIGDAPDLSVLDTAGDVKTGAADLARWMGGGRSGGGGATGAFEGGPGLAPIEAKALPAVVEGRSNPLASAGAFVDSDEIAAVLIALVALAGAVLAAVFIVWTAPALLAELSLDAAVSSGLYRRLRRVGGDHWLRTAMRRTALPFLGVAAAM